MNHAQLLRANKLQEDLIKASLLPYSILRSTQFFEFIAGVVQDGSRSDVVIPPAFIQPVSGLDVAEALADIVTGKPQNRIVELAGPERFWLSDLASEVRDGARIAKLRFEDWLRESLQPSAPPSASRVIGDRLSRLDLDPSCW
jgi:uncharacterized protein YbjT (DUF2867 family)